MSNEKKYHDLLDKLAEAIKKGKRSDIIERIKEKIEDAEQKIHTQQKERKHKK